MKVGNTVGVCTVQVVRDLGVDRHVGCEGRTLSFWLSLIMFFEPSPCGV